jgi:threonine synthase
MLFDIKNNEKTVTYKDSIQFPIPSPGSLWFPKVLSTYDKTILKHTKMNIAIIIIDGFLNKELSLATIKEIANDVFTFDAPCIKISEKKYLCDLTQGPTKAFKDFGARLAARITQNLLGSGTIAAATSGDTGGAIVCACEDSNINSLVLYPLDRISTFQKNQISNQRHKKSIPISVEGTFDDCQDAIKIILANSEKIYSGNSVSILRLIAQIVYYFWIAKELDKEFSVTVPTGNLGNAVAAVMAKVMGAPIDKIVIAGNTNCKLTHDVIFENGFIPKTEAKSTMSSAMDVCAPSNLIRLQYLCKKYNFLQDSIIIKTVNEHNIIDTIVSTYSEHNILIDPHTSVGIFASKCQKVEPFVNINVILSTASPIKFIDVIEKILPKETINTYFTKSTNPTMVDTVDTVDSKDIAIRTSALPKIIKRKNIILTGMPGTGKTTCGRKLAEFLKMDFINIDTHIEEKYNASLQEIIRQYGQNEFTQIEKTACIDSIENNKNIVISPGGSANLIQDVFDKSKESCLVIWIDTNIDVLLSRLGDLDERGVVMEPGETFENLFERRCINYKKNYDIVINNNNFPILCKFLKYWYGPKS